jgi:hypothetical protein
VTLDSSPTSVSVTFLFLFLFFFADANLTAAGRESRYAFRQTGFGGCPGCSILSHCEPEHASSSAARSGGRDCDFGPDRPEELPGQPECRSEILFLPHPEGR